MKEFKSYRGKRPFLRPDRRNMSRDYAIAIGGLAIIVIGWLALMFLLAFARGG